MNDLLFYVFRILKNGGKIVITEFNKLYDSKGNFVCCLSDSDLRAITENQKEVKL